VGGGSLRGREKGRYFPVISLTQLTKSLLKLEAEEVLDILREGSKSAIKRTFEKLFQRPIRDQELRYIKERWESGEKKYRKIQFYNQTREVADAYRYKYGLDFDERKANGIARWLFGRNFREKELNKAKELLSKAAPKRPSILYRWIAEEIRRVRDQREGLGLEEAYREFVLRPPYDFEIKLHEK